jgi:hypothetical protein
VRRTRAACGVPHVAAKLFRMGFRQFGRLRERFQRGLMGLVGVFHGLAGMFVSGEVILLAVLRGGGTVRVRGHFVEFGSSIMRIVVHHGSFSG